MFFNTNNDELYLFCVCVFSVYTCAFKLMIFINVRVVPINLVHKQLKPNLLQSCTRYLYIMLLKSTWN